MKLNEKGWPKNRVVKEKVKLSAKAKKLLKNAKNKEGVATEYSQGYMSNKDREALYKAFVSKIKGK